jgi:hypothetical protein
MVVLLTAFLINPTIHIPSHLYSELRGRSISNQQMLLTAQLAGQSSFSGLSISVSHAVALSLEGFGDK